MAQKGVSQGLRWISISRVAYRPAINSRVPTQTRGIQQHVAAVPPMSWSPLPPPHFQRQQQQKQRQQQQQLGLSKHFSTTPTKGHGDVTPPKPGEEVYVTFLDRDKAAHKIACSIGDNLLDIAQANDLDVEGACGGSCACSTCHLIVADQKYYDLLTPETEDEGDMLDLAFGLTDTSRLGCQVIMSREIDGIVVKLPSATRNLQQRDFEGN